MRRASWHRNGTIFGGVLCIYFVTWCAVGAYVLRVFGITCALGLSIVLILPLLVAFRLLVRWQRLGAHELVLLLTLVCVAVVTSTWIIVRWYDAGIDIWHHEDVECAEFKQLLKTEPAFRNVAIDVSKGHFFWIHGTVSSQADLNRLRHLSRKYSIDWNENIDVVPNRGK